MSAHLIPRRLSFKETAAFLGLPNLGELQKLRVKYQRAGLAFPVLGPDGFLEHDVLALKGALDALIARAGNAQSIAPPSVPSHPAYDRRSGVADRRRCAP